MSRAQLLARNMKRRAPKPEPEPITHDAPPAPLEPSGSGYVGYHIEARGAGWHVLIGPDGEQVGKASRDVDELHARIPGED